MDKERFSYLFEQFYKKDASFDEKDEFFLLLGSGKYDEQLIGLIDIHFEDFEPQINPFSPETEHRMLQAIFESRVSEHQIENRHIPVRKLWSRIAAAASIILVAGIALYFYSNKIRQDVVRNTFNSSSITPGKNSATLTLANGKKILLSSMANGALPSEAGVTITKTADGQIIYQTNDQQNASASKINTLSTAKGETYQVRLPDGSLVALNAASSLSYSTALSKMGERRVELTGEAYFEVAKDKLHPFIVKTTSQEIKVLGTHFNVNSYSDEASVKTTLLEGAVNVATATDQRILKPGEQAIAHANRINVVKADLESAVAWKNGEFVFTGLSITEIMRQLSRWYNVEIEYRGPVTTERFEGSAMKEKNITEVLELLQLTDAVHFKIEGRKIIVTK